MEFDFDLGRLDHDGGFQDEPLDLHLPPPVPPLEPPRRGRPDPADDAGMVGWVILAIVALLGVLKLALFAAGGAASAIAIGVVFVVAHGAALAAGATWFWGRRYA